MNEKKETKILWNVIHDASHSYAIQEQTSNRMHFSLQISQFVVKSINHESLRESVWPRMPICIS